MSQLFRIDGAKRFGVRRIPPLCFAITAAVARNTLPLTPNPSPRTDSPDFQARPWRGEGK